MVVIILISMLALLAVPSMATAREDRLAFRSADQLARVVHEARTRAMARGAAQLVVLTTNGTSDRGTAIAYETLDATLHPISSCKTPGQWAGAILGGSATNPVVAGHNLNGTAASLQAQTGLETAMTVSGVAALVTVMCFTPGGRVYAVPSAAGPTSAAVNALPVAQPFTGEVVLAVMRKRGGGTAQGLTRNVIISASGATRIRSQ